MAKLNNETTYENWIFGNWDHQSKILKQQFPLLTDHDLRLEAGKEGELLSKLETRLYKNREEMISIIKRGREQPFSGI